MNRQLKQTACPRPPQGSNLVHRAELQGCKTAARPAQTVAEAGFRAVEYSARRWNRRDV
jgi:hypothetical protein